MVLPALLLASVLYANAGDAGDTEEETRAKESGVDALGVPLVSFNSDLGFGFGAAGGAYFYAPGYTPFRHAVSAQVFFTTRGVQNHFLRYDGPRLIGPLRMEAKLEFRRELLSPYFGPGNQASPEFELDPDINNRRWNYEKLAPAAWVRARIKPFGPKHPFEPYLGYAFRWYSVTVFPGSVLARQRPLGVEGGIAGQVIAGATWDTRSSEGDPLSGGVEELSFRFSARETGSRYTYAGLTASSRRFFTLGTPRLILAQRLLVDFLFGDVPFFEWPNTGGLQPAEGVGGVSSVRGVIRNRYTGNIKTFVNTELRYYPFDFKLFKVTTKVGGVVYVDLGRTWQPDLDDGPFTDWHPAVGAGLRLARRQAVIRFDTGVALETGRLGIYLTFAHMF